MQTESLEVLQGIAQTIFDKKGFNILAIDVREVSTLTNYFLIAEGSVNRHVQALSREIKDFMGKAELKPLHVEGEEQGDWLVMDYGDIVIHLFIPELRERYGFERVWHAGSVVDLDVVPEEERR